MKLIKNEDDMICFAFLKDLLKDHFGFKIENKLERVN